MSIKNYPLSTNFLKLNLQFFAEANRILSLEEFTRETLIGYVEALEVPFDPVLLQFLPKDEKTWDLDFAYDIIEGAKGAAASLMPFGSPAPLRGGRGVKTMMQEVAKIHHARRIDEREQLKFMNARNDEEKQQVINRVYDIVDELKLGVIKMEEWLRAAAIYRGKLEHNDKANGVVVEVDFGIPSANKVALTGEDKWDNHDAANPLQDLIEYGMKFRRANSGRYPMAIHLSLAAAYDVIRCKSTVAAIKGNAGGTVTLQEVDEHLQRFNLPGLTINDEEIFFEEEGSSQRFLPERRVALLGIAGQNSLGSTVEGPTAKNGGNPGIYVDPYTDQYTANEFIEVGESVFPALKYTSGVMHLDV